MARKADYNREEVLADWKTGKYSVRKLADKHRVSPGTIHGIVKNIVITSYSIHYTKLYESGMAITWDDLYPESILAA